MIIRILKNKFAYLSISFVLYLLALPAISYGTTHDAKHVFLLGLSAVIIGALIPPLQRVIFPPKQ